MPLRISGRSIRKTILQTLIIGAVMASAGLPAQAGSTSTGLSGPSGSTAYGENAGFTATVYGSVPGGTVTLKDGSKKLAAETLDAPLGVKGIISPGEHHTCAITAAGAAKCWGRNNLYGQLGNGTKSNAPTPVQVNNLGSGVIAIASSYNHSCALTKEGAVKCWGNNGTGNLGNGSIAESLSPVQVTGLTSGVVAITAGGYHTCALTDAGAVKCWGSNGFSQLGNGTTGGMETTPTDVVGLGSGVSAIAAGSRHTCALADQGAAYCWGRNTHGELGNGSTGDQNVPVPVSNMTSGVVSIAGGFYHTCGVTGSGAARCWGYNNNGQLGDNSTDSSTIPVQVSGLTSGVVAVGTGNYFSCALTEAGGVKCWGNNGGSNQTLGAGPGGDALVPIQVTGLMSGAVALASLYNHSCAVTNAGAAKCWGDNFFDQIGDGNMPTDAGTPTAVTGFGDNATLVPAVANFDTTKLSAGKRKLTAAFGGDSNNAASTSDTLAHVVDKGKTETTVKAKPKSPKAGGNARLKIKIKAKKPAAGKPKGKAVVKDGKNKLGKFKVKKGKVKIALRDLKAGQHKIKVKYKGEKNWKKSTGKTKLKVKN
jgi:alpha-tubulin suppressor-like RCC1 family protein